MENKILITGATGDLGSKVITLLKEKTKVENLAVLVRDEKNDLISTQMLQHNYA
jgi:NAD(P)H dehydrogenase (quinone)